MEAIKNNYQLSKTLRFGLTQKSKTRKDGFTGEIYQSHNELKDLVKSSEDRIKKSVSTDEKSEMSLSVDKIRCCLVMISDFLSSWQQVYSRADQIALDKDYYKILCKKIGFDGFWVDERYDRKNDKTVRTKKPQSRTINLSELDKKDDKGIERRQYLLTYWRDNLINAADKFEVVTEKLKQFEDALNINRTYNKPNEVELRKLFLSLTNIVQETLQPLCLGQICFPKLEKIDDSRTENKHLIDFATDYQSKSDLLSEISELKKYFEENGGNVPYCRATLNQKTAVKNPNSTDNSIDSEIKKLGLDKILKENKDALYFANKIYSLSAKEKLSKLDDKTTGLIERSLLFKYKPVPAIVQYEIAKTLSETINKSEEDLLEFLRSIGQTKSPTKDYADLQDKNDFDLDAYPLKVAFDFAWENLARSIYHSDADIPVAVCEGFLKKNFGIDKSNADFKLYAQLQELKAVLATLEYGNPTNRQTFINEATKLLSPISWDKIGRNGNQNKYSIEKWLKTLTKDDKDYKDAKQQIALFRGRLKNNIKTFDDITKYFKSVAMEMGRTFAQMRDKITGAAELNKVTHYAIIIEDQNFDKYVLLQEFVDKKENRIYAKTDRHHSDFTTYSVNSVTSGSIAKMLRKKRMDELNRNNRNSFEQKPELSEEQKEQRNIREWKEFIEDKRWDLEFQLNLSNKTFEQIKKEVDAKCYELDINYISQETLSDLVNKKGCLLLPIVSQDIAKENKTEGNQFTKDWNAIFTQETPWRLTPEFRVSYRKPTPNYPVSDKGDKRYSRFQMIAHFLCDYLPKSDSYISNWEQIANYKDDKLQEKAVKEFNADLRGRTEEEKQSESVNALLAHFGNQNKKQKPVERPKEKFYVFGIDRGQKELATLCVIDQDKKIVGDFDIYTRSFNSEAKQWEHKLLEKRVILDLSNLRVETTIVIDGKPEKKKVLVDLSEVKVKDKDGKYSKPNKMQVKMQQLAYIRKLQFQMQTNPDAVLEWYANNKTKEQIMSNFVDNENGDKGLVSFYGTAVEELNETLPIDKIEEILKKFQELKDKEKQGETVKLEIDKLVQLEPVDNLKNGVVANMVGVIAYLLQNLDYQVYISLEDLSKPFSGQIIGGIAGVPTKTNKEEGRRADVEKYAGLGLYNFFEMQLLKKLFRIQQDSQNILHLVPPFRAMKNYDHVAVGKGKVKNQFGIVFFVDADATSKTCPCCGSSNNKPNLKMYPNAKKGLSKEGKEVWVERDKSEGNDIIRCFVCGFDTTKDYSENPLRYIKSGDDNAAYLISAEGIKAYELATTLVNNK
ncbi:MAG: hypothetical protein PHU62_03730 [Bacteroidales bacterium]|nr:hypothetical protein [Bacteroidales bacterium]MDD2204267.1 hypothetical protein [Bacteroidales bacterium]MDD3913561.1 hypothetical protein [Bacteroidales bacterium]MDD4633671.1 hypothetical protein [Bacteroidales bacterium]